MEAALKGGADTLFDIDWQGAQQLREAGFVELEEGGGYGLTPLGRDLCEMVMPLHRFAERWKR